MSYYLVDGYGHMPYNKHGSFLTGSGTLVTATGRVANSVAVRGPSTSSQSLRYPLGAGITEIVGGFAFQTISANAIGSGSVAGAMMLLGSAASTTQLCVNLNVNGQPVLRRGSANSTVIASAVPNVQPATWHHWGWRATLADSGGIFQGWLDEQLVIDYTGDTRNTGTDTLWTTLDLGGMHSSDGHWFESLYLINASGAAPTTFQGDKVVKIRRGNANGAQSQFVGSDGNSVDNYALTNETPVGTTTYAGSGTAGQQDLYGFEDMPAGSIDAVQNTLVALKTDAGTRNVKALMRSSGGTIVASSELVLTTTQQTVSDIVRTTDADGLAWTQTGFNGHEFGAEVV